MAAKKDIQVLIGGKIYTLSGYESEEYLQKIALYINNKMEEMDQIPNYRAAWRGHAEDAAGAEHG